MNSSVKSHLALRFNPEGPLQELASVSAGSLDPELTALLSGYGRPADQLKSIFRVKVIPDVSEQADDFPDVSGQYLLADEEVEFIPTFPFESGITYRATFDPRPLGFPIGEGPRLLDFVVPSEQNTEALTEVVHVFPSGDVLPENLLRFYVRFSNSMQRGRALDQISLLDSEGRPVNDALYRPPVELWDGNMRHLTVLLDPGRLKRWVGPNVELGPPLKAGQKYTLEIGSGMLDQYGRPIRERFQKHFVAGDPVREPIAVQSWKLLPPVTGGRQALVLTFANPLDWALLLRTITIRSADGSVIDGQAGVDQCETGWRFTPASPWAPGVYRISVGFDLEDVCGNTITGAFDRPLRNGPLPSRPTEPLKNSSLIFKLF